MAFAARSATTASASAWRASASAWWRGGLGTDGIVKGRIGIGGALAYGGAALEFIGHGLQPLRIRALNPGSFLAGPAFLVGLVMLIIS